MKNCINFKCKILFFVGKDKDVIKNPSVVKMVLLKILIDYKNLIAECLECLLLDTDMTVAILKTSRQNRQVDINREQNLISFILNENLNFFIK